MLLSLALIFVLGLLAAEISRSARLPRIVGMIFAGILLGPSALGLLSPEILELSPQLRKMALVIILIKAGLSLDVSVLKRVGRPALLLSFLPASFEMAGCVFFGPKYLGLSLSESALLGSVLAAVSPAVVVPAMVRLIEAKRGTEKGIPQMILAGASLDDVFVIVLFSVFLGTSAGGGQNLVSSISRIPVSISLGVVLGMASGFLLSKFFRLAKKIGRNIRATTKAVVLLSVSFMFCALESKLEEVVSISSLLAVLVCAASVRFFGSEKSAARMGDKFGKVWIAGEVILFVLVGAAVDVRAAMESSIPVLALIFSCLAVRSLGVLLSLSFTKLNIKERIFCVAAYLPKATVQAAIGSVPLAAGLQCGPVVLSAAVTAILVTAPLGALLISLLENRLLEKESEC